MNEEAIAASNAPIANASRLANMTCNGHDNDKTAEKRSIPGDGASKAKRSRPTASKADETSFSVHQLMKAPDQDVRRAHETAKLRRKVADSAVSEAVLVFTVAQAEFNIAQAEVNGLDSVVRTRGMQKVVDTPAPTDQVSAVRSQLGSSSYTDYAKADADEIRKALGEAKCRCVVAVAGKKAAEIAMAGKKAVQQVAPMHEQGVKNIMRARSISEHVVSTTVTAKAKVKTSTKK